MNTVIAAVVLLRRAWARSSSLILAYASKTLPWRKGPREEPFLPACRSANCSGCGYPSSCSYAAAVVAW